MGTWSETGVKCWIPKSSELEVGQITHFHNVDCADYEKQIDALRAELARVKAESLRVVNDGGAVTAFRLDGNDKFIQVEGEVYYRSGEALICTNTRIYQGLDDDTIVQPVRLERWEDE